MRFAKLAAAAAVLITASVVGGTLIGSVLAAPRGTASTHTHAADENDGSKLAANAGKYCDVFIDTLASKLGVDRDALLPAAKDAAKTAIDAAVAAGDLDSDRATALKDRIEQATGQGCHLLGARLHAAGKMHVFAHGFGRGFIHADVLGAATDAMKIDRATLFSRMAGGDSLKDVAADQGVDYGTVTKAVLDALDADLKAAVDNGLSQDRADAVRERVATWLNAGGEAPMHRLRDHLGQQPSSFSFR
jgi:hypothetical protein